MINKFMSTEITAHFSSRFEKETLKGKNNCWQHDHDTFAQKSILFHQIKQLIITRETLGPTHWTGTHKQAARLSADVPSNSLFSPQIGPASLYQITIMASSIVQTMDWRNWDANTQLKPDFIYFKISHCLTWLFSKVGDWPGWNSGPMHLSHQYQLVLWRVGLRSLQRMYCEQKRSEVKQQSSFVSWENHSCVNKLKPLTAEWLGPR